MFDTGRYFRYTYWITFNALIFDVSKNIKLKEIIFGIYHKDNLHESNKLAEISIDP
jgi:hypothetical protein